MSDNNVQGEDLTDLFGASERDSEEGKWFKLGRIAEVKLRRFNSKKSQKVRQALEAPYKKGAYQFRDLPEDLLDEITNEHIATGIIVDWRGIVKDGKPLNYSKGAAIALLSAYPDLKSAIISLAISIDQFRDDVKETGEGN